MGADLVIRTHCMKIKINIGIFIVFNRLNWDNDLVYKKKEQLIRNKDNIIFICLDENDFCDYMSSMIIRELFDEKNWKKL